MNHATTQSVLFPDLLAKPPFVRFDKPDLTSDGVAFLLKKVDARLGLTERLADCVVDGRQQGKLRHSFPDLPPAAGVRAGLWLR
jgi:hypothetical protein